MTEPAGDPDERVLDQVLGKLAIACEGVREPKRRRRMSDVKVLDPSGGYLRRARYACPH